MVKQLYCRTTLQISRVCERRNHWWGGGRIVLALIAIAPTLLLGSAEVAAQTADEQASASSDAPVALKLSMFDLDVTPPIGSMMAYDPVKKHDELGLRCRGIVLTGTDKPIVLCAVDWIGIANAAHDEFRRRLAEAAGTDVSHVSVHTLHQHDAPRCDFTAEQLLHHAGATELGSFQSAHQREVLDRLSESVRQSLQVSHPVTHVGFGTSEVKKVASNRRLLGPDGNVYATRYTACRDPEMRAEPEGTIDPELSCVVFYHEKDPLVSLTYYACHPQSYYRTGIPSPDFPGIARILRAQDSPEVMHVHFNGAGGNIGAGKYNDGSSSNRLVLAGRVADAMRQAYESVERFPVEADDVRWSVVSLALPAAPHLDEQKLRDALQQPAPSVIETVPADLAWLLRCQSGHQIDIGCLAVGDVRVLHLPGELFVEYQLAAKAMREDLHVAMAAYGDYGPGYIGTEIAYGQGGYETSQRASRVASSVEPLLIDAIGELLEVGSAGAEATQTTSAETASAETAGDQR
ncbi:hypothetical protein [Roseiconus lacunae]|uniref:Neutral/alkaline non-lysosomal ceramidase N-terminal domain-containing protein n=1 Tax=Roseiconus lacunae TaxID=2605694 RepID=A0ABT7PIB3_9BACT|nr:hypothetical protein [Roseiconus lacunae]MDM4016230.1 hypothetical protein [Roseiconus lacunae]